MKDSKDSEMKFLESQATTSICESCKSPYPEGADNKNPLHRRVWRAAVLHDTPKEVWDIYQEDGIGPIEALTMETSYI